MNLPKDSPADSDGTLTAEDRPADEKGFMDFNEGEEYTGIGRIVRELVMKTHSFIVFVDEYGGVQWGYNSVPVLAKDYSIVSNRVARLETRSRFLRRAGGPPPDKSEAADYQHALFSARRLIAEGMSRLLDSGSLEAAQGMLDVAEKWIDQRSIECSRHWLLIPFASLAGTGLLTFFLLLLTLGLPADGSPWLWFLGALLGGVGSLVSSVIFNRKISFDATAGRSLHFLEALLRWGVGFVAGLTVQLLIQGNIFLGLLGGSDTPSAVATLVLSLLAGSSEIFFPTLLRRFDNGLDSAPQPESPATETN